MVKLLPLLLAADQQAEPLLVRLDPEQRARVLMALLGLILLGALLIAIIYFGGRHMRRIARQGPGETRDARDEWYRKPLVPSEPPSPPAPDPK